MRSVVAPRSTALIRPPATNIKYGGLYQQPYPLMDTSNHQSCNLSPQRSHSNDVAIGRELVARHQKVPISVVEVFLKSQPRCTTQMPQFSVQSISPQQSFAGVMQFKLTETPTYDLQRPRKNYRKSSLKIVTKKKQHGKVPHSRISDPLIAVERDSLKKTTSYQSRGCFKHAPRTTNEARPVVALDPVTKENIHLFESCSEAARVQGINRTKLSRICRSGGGLIGGLLYRYQDDQYITSRSHFEHENVTLEPPVSLAAQMTEPTKEIAPNEEKMNHLSKPDENTPDVHHAAELLTHFRCS